MILALRGEVFGPGKVIQDAVGEELHVREGIAQAYFDEADGEVGNGNLKEKRRPSRRAYSEVRAGYP